MKTVDRLAIAWFRGMGAAGLILSLVVFVLYVAGVIPSEISPEDSAALWNESSGTFLDETSLVFKPGWFINPGTGFFYSTAALALLGSTALPTLCALACVWLYRRDYLYASMSLLISVVLTLAVIGK